MSSFQEILSAACRIAKENPSHVFIGGIAVYLHAVNHARTKSKAEASHDIDLMIDLHDYGALRQAEEVLANKRLGKHQLIRDGVEFDIYVERQNRLRVPYDAAFAYAISYNGLRVACLEHLLVLKLEALVSRAGSGKGNKDARDVVTIVRGMQGGFRQSQLLPFLRDRHIEALKQVADGDVFIELTGGNAFAAKTLRTEFGKFMAEIKKRR